MDKKIAILDWTKSRRFWAQGKKFRVGKSGVQTLDLLQSVSESRRCATDVRWLLPYRDQFRIIARLAPRPLLIYLAEHAPDPGMRCLAIWLRGRCSGMFGTSTLAAMRNDANPLVRKEVTRALRRMHAWSVLRDIELSESVARIRRMASPVTPDPYGDRMAGFLGHVPRRMTYPRLMPLVVSEDVDPQSGRPPKSRWQIRKLLYRIRRLVRGSSEQLAAMHRLRRL